MIVILDEGKCGEGVERKNAKLDMNLKINNNLYDKMFGDILY